MIKRYPNKGINTLPGKNICKSIIKTDRYGIQYVKNFTIWDDGVSLQTWDTENPHVKHHCYMFT